MRIEDSFRVGLPVEDAWKLLLDIERVAPCMPGFELKEVEGDEYRGLIKIKVGPITAQYKGSVTIDQMDEVEHRVVFKAKGRDVHGQGNANATVTGRLEPESDGTKVTIDADLHISGKVAQIGRGVMQEVASNVLLQFVEALERNFVTAGASQPATSGEAEPIDLLRVSRRALAKRAAPVLALLLAILLTVWLWL